MGVSQRLNVFHIYSIIDKFGEQVGNRRPGMTIAWYVVSGSVSKSDSVYLSIINHNRWHEIAPFLAVVSY